MMCSLWFSCGLLFNSGRKKTGCHFWLPIDCAPVSRDCPCGVAHHFVYCETGQSAIATSAHGRSGLWFFVPSKQKKASYPKIACLTFLSSPAAFGPGGEHPLAARFPLPEYRICHAAFPRFSLFVPMSLSLCPQIPNAPRL